MASSSCSTGKTKLHRGIRLRPATARPRSRVTTSTPPTPRGSGYADPGGTGTSPRWPWRSSGCGGGPECDTFLVLEHGWEDGLDKVRAGVREGPLQLGREVVGRLGAARRHPHALRDGDEVEVRPRKVEQVGGTTAGRLGADPLQLEVEDGVRAVVEDYRRDIEPLPRLRPQGLDRVHRAAIGLERHNLAVRAGNRRSRGHGQALANRASGEAEPVVGWCTS